MAAPATNRPAPSARLRLAVVCPTNLSEGRGAENVLAGVLPALAARADVLVLSLGATNGEFKAIADNCGVTLLELEHNTRGWFVLNARETATRVAQEAGAWDADLVVLYWEIWDLVRALPPVLEAAGLPVAVLLHAIPFAYAPARPTSFYWDGIKRVLRDRDPISAQYTLRHMHGVGKTLRSVPVISANETVSYYLRAYFPSLEFAEALPCSAIAVPPTLEPTTAEYDCVFMAKLIPGKGIFQLPTILGRIAARRPGTRLLVLGTFETEADERRFRAMLGRSGTAERVDLAGWVRGESKYSLLAKGRVFLYPSFAADTFAISLLESLACGIPAVTYDVPFARAVYDTPAVHRTPVGDLSAFADAALRVLESDDYAQLSAQAIEFADRYSSWDRVAKSQEEAFHWALTR
ncbi:glycosyltransferase involved in cell wall biosynthesis [Kitasatospora sp. GP30]|uniref:glycosyltransferase family 4 protein n=1 Tax=Kitasatospora sp. GP30 TaxID=3035084 RepID=UPI000C703D0C|nr:glycosyltransferase family 4 protein [Kitasatospora sp. GP30]MDH6138468.1 glycosyltransferase involved in cell wall biosynthesis [Kitasatospora sp. GP30]